MSGRKNISLKIFLFLTVGMTALVSLVSLVGITAHDFYSKETLNWQAQSFGQDAVDLFLIVPVLFITGILTFKNNWRAAPVWAGTTLYLLYTFVIYCFDLHFNVLFVIYCFILGMSFYGTLYFFYIRIRSLSANDFISNSIIRTIAVYFLIVSGGFYFLWLSEIIPATLHNVVPASLSDAGLVTNPVHILDLSVFLPGFFITGLLLFKKHPLGLLLVPVLLTFFVLMDLTIATLVVVMHHRGLESNLIVAVVMSALAALSLIMMILYFNNKQISMARLWQ